MKVITAIISLSATTSALAHTGDHSGVSSALAHTFGSLQHLAAAVAVMASVAGVIALSGKLNAKLASYRAK